MLFQADGFVRVASKTYDLRANDSMFHVTNAHGQESNKGHFRSFQTTARQLASEYPGLFAPDFFAKAFRQQADRAARYAALAQFKPISYGGFKRKPRVGFFHLFACDWVGGGRHGERALARVQRLARSAQQSHTRLWD